MSDKTLCLLEILKNVIVSRLYKGRILLSLSLPVPVCVCVPALILCVRVCACVCVCVRACKKGEEDVGER